MSRETLFFCVCFTPEWHFVLQKFLRHFKEFVLVTLRGEQIYSRCHFPNAIHLGVFFSVLYHSAVNG